MRLVWCLCLALTTAWAEDVADAALTESGLSGGVAVVVGAPDAARALAVANGGQFVVEELLADWPTVYQRRAAFGAAAAYPLVNAQIWRDQTQLPYAPQLVNLLVVDADALGSAAPSDDELRRVLAYEGAAYIRRGGAWSLIRNATPDDVDEWGHALRGPDRRPVSTDTQIRPHMNGLRWMADQYNSLGQNATGLRIADGVIYSTRSWGGRWIETENGRRTYDRTQFYEIVARDAYNGVLKWVVQVPWLPIYRGNSGREDSMEYSHHFAAGNGRLYCYPTLDGHLSALDAQTGAVVQVYDQTVTLTSGNTDAPTYFHRKGGLTTIADPDGLMRSTVIVVGSYLVQSWGNDLWVMDEATGAVLGHYNDGQAIGGALVGSDGHIYAVNGQRAVSLTVPEAQPRWQTTLPYQGDVHALTGPLNGGLPIHLRGGRHGRENQGLIILNTADGTVRWAKDRFHGNHAVLLEDRLTLDGWTGSNDFDPVTGSEIEGHGIKGDMAGCSYPTYTGQYLIRGLTLHDRQHPSTAWPSDGARPDCQMPTYPAYGSLFVFGAKCGCSTFLRSGLASFYASEPVDLSQPAAHAESASGLVAQSPGGFVPVTMSPGLRLDWTRGEAFTDGHKGFNLLTMPRPVVEASRDAKTRSFYGSGGRVRSLDAGDLTVVLESNRNLLAAERDGTRLWELPIGARALVDPVTIGDTVYVGLANGWLLAIAVSDGSIRWHYHAAPAERRMVAVGQIESAWPVSALAVVDGQLLIAAGRRDSFDDGISVRCLDPQTGTLVWHEIIARPRLQLENTEEMSRRGYTGFGNKFSTHTGLWTPNQFDTAYYLIGTIPVSPQLRRAPPQPISGGAPGAPGLRFTYYEVAERPQELPDLDTLEALQEGVVADVTADLEAVPRTIGPTSGDQYAIRLTGQLHIESETVLRLVASSQGFMRVWLDGKVVLDRTGGVRSSGPMMPLAAGTYALQIDFCTNAKRTIKGTMRLMMQREGQETHEPLPASWLSQPQ